MTIIEKAKQVIAIEIAALERISARLDENFINAIELIAKTVGKTMVNDKNINHLSLTTNNYNKIIVSGVGKSGIIGQKIAATFSSIGVSSVFLHPVEALHGDIGMVQKDDVVILLSKSGNTEELVRLIPYLKMRSAKIISIVGKPTSFLATNSDITLDASVETEACPFNLAPTASTTVALSIGDALAVCLMHERKFTLEDFSRLHPLGQIGRTTTLTVKDVMHSIDDIAVAPSHTVFKDALIKMSQKNFGCICITNEENQLLGILTDGDVRRVLQSFDDVLNLELNQLMTKNPVIVRSTAPLIEALALMENRTNQISVLPVVDDKILLGLIRIHDIIV